MCFEFDASPPFVPEDLLRPPMAGGAGAEIVEVTSADGTRFSAALAEAPEASAPAVVILPDVRGLYPFYVELAERFVSAGRHAVAIDYFGRTGGTGVRGEDFDFWPHVEQTTAEQVQADAAAAMAALGERTGATRFVTVGFCFGGSHSFMAAASDLDLAGAVGFYGSLKPRRPGAPDVLAQVGQMRGPILGLFGEADEAIPLDLVAQFEEELGAAGVEAEIVTYPGAPHSFFDRKQEQFAEASADAWRRVLGFLDHVEASVAA